MFYETKIFIAMTAQGGHVDASTSFTFAVTIRSAFMQLHVGKDVKTLS